MTGLSDGANKVCLRCGSCLSACPVYKKQLNEMVAPRGKMALAEAISHDEMPAKHDTASYLSQCLVCTACMDSCPNNLNVDIRMIAGRSALKRHKIANMPFFAAFRTVLQTRSLMDVGAFFGRLFSRLLFFRVPGESGLHLRFPILVPRSRLLPKIAITPFLKSEKKKRGKEHSSSSKAPYAYFVGCMGNYSCTEVPNQLLALQNKIGGSISVPLDQRCCGMPAIVAGDLQSARKLARRNINVLLKTGAEKIITACGSCGSAIKHYYPALFDDDENTRKSAEEVASRIVDVSELIAHSTTEKTFAVNKDLLKRLGLESEKRVKVTYHESCHLGRRMGVIEAPKQILRRIEGIEFVPMKDENVCCGCGGLFSVHHYDISSAITADKAENIRATGAQIVATGCPACAMQIADGLAHAGLDIPVVHTIELISSS
ncbi:MAG: (Fe-S)-binding protein [Candidatus Coatesbacteria bacterium]|nr:(Fe-S)-binding protein [Candidatus Coatesbacteria bacterium]